MERARDDDRLRSLLHPLQGAVKVRLEIEDGAPGRVREFALEPLQVPAALQGRGGRRREDEPVDLPRQDGDHPDVVLVAQHAYERVAGPRRRIGTQCVGQHPGAVGVVGDVEDPRSPDLEPPWQVGAAEARRPGLPRGPERRRQRVQRRERHPRIRLLVRAEQAQRSRRRPLRVHENHRAGAVALRLGGQYVPDGDVALTGDERDVALRDARLLAGDGGEVGSQVLGMLAGDLGHHARERRDDVGGVESPAHAHLDDGDVHAPGGEVSEGERSGRLEKARVETLDVGLQESRPFGERVRVDRDSIHHDTLPHGDEVR